jgi:hypothetical protein
MNAQRPFSMSIPQLRIAPEIVRRCAEDPMGFMTLPPDGQAPISRVNRPDQAQDPSSVLLAFIGREDVAEDLGANRFDGDSVRSSREQQGLLLVSRFVG